MADPKRYDPPDFIVPSSSDEVTESDVSGVYKSARDAAPDFSGVYVDPSQPTEMGAPDVFPSIVAPNFYKGGIDALTFLVDLPTMAAHKVMEVGAEAIGYEGFPKKPVLLSDIIRGGFEAPATIESAITGEAPTITKGFSATPRAPRTDEERAYRDWSYITGGALSFPVGLANFYGHLGLQFGKRAWDPVQKLLGDASQRGLNSTKAQEAIAEAVRTGKTPQGPGFLESLNNVAKEYAESFAKGVGISTTKTLSRELSLGFLAGAGYAGPEFFNDENQQISMDLGDGVAVDIKPTLKVITSLGLPIVLAHTPGGLALAGDKTKIVPFIKWVKDRATVLGKSAVAGLNKEGQFDMASRIVGDMQSQPGFLENYFLPAVESGMFSTPGKSTPIRILEDGTIIPEAGGLRPDTLQAMRELGVSDTRLAALESSLRGKGTRGEVSNLQARIAEGERRATTLDDTFDLLKQRVQRVGDDDPLVPPNEADTYGLVQKVHRNLEADAIANVENAATKADEVFRLLEPEIGREQASQVAMEIIEGARAHSRNVRRELWSKENIGTDHVNASYLGDWAAQKIAELGKAARVLPGMGLLYKLAGGRRLNEMGIGESGRPIKPKDLEGVQDVDGPLTPEAIGRGGLFDQVGPVNTIAGAPVTTTELHLFRSELGDLARAARRTGNEKVASRYEELIDQIDDNVVVPENLLWGDKGATAENIRNLEIARKYTFDEKNLRWGPKTIIGQFLRNPLSIDEGFLNTLIKPGPTSGQRVEMWRNAINEPQRPVDGKTTWERDPTAPLVPEGYPTSPIEADLLRRFTETIVGGKVTQKHVDNFLRKYDEAVGKIPGLREKFMDLRNAQMGVDLMTAKLTNPSREKVVAALQEGATLDDINTTKRVLKEDFEDTRLRTVASNYLEADVDAAATRFIDTVMNNPSNAKGLVDDMDNLLRRDETGAAAAGFRGAIWRGLRNASKRVGPDGEPLPGINTAKLVEIKDKMKPLLSKFYTDDQLTFLDELVKGGRIQDTGISVEQAALSPEEIMATRQAFASQEAIAAGGRIAGQQVFGAIGINPLVATGQGRRIAAYTFRKLGEDKIFKIIEDAFRDPEKAAALVRRYKELESWVPPDEVSAVAEAVAADPAGVAKNVAAEGGSRLKNIAKGIGDYIKNHSREAIERAVKLGLLPAQAEARKISVEEDWIRGEPYQYDENRVRSIIEKQKENQGLQIDIPAPPPNIGPVTEAAPEAPPRRQMAALPMRPPSPDSALSQVSPVQPLNTAQRGLQIFGANDPVFKDVQTAKDGGIMSVKCKPRQMVG